MTTPEWVEHIANEVAVSFNRKAPPIHWRVSKQNRGTSGSYWPTSGHIAVTAGSDEQWHLPVLLHELAHWQRDWHAKKRRSHDMKWARLAVDLYVRYGVLDFVLSEEFHERQRVHNVSRSLGLGGRERLPDSEKWHIHSWGNTRPLRPGFGYVEETCSECGAWHSRPAREGDPLKA